MQAADGVYQLKIPAPRDALIMDNSLEYTLCYLIQLDEGWGLVDTGWDDDAAFAAFMEQLNTLKVAPKDIRWVLITHFHPDHVGLVTRLRQFCEAKLIMHAWDSPQVFWKRVRSQSVELAEQAKHWLCSQGMPVRESAAAPFLRIPVSKFIPSLEVDVKVREKGCPHPFCPELTLLWTPGHSPGHLCLYDRDRKILFSGDLLLPSITTNVSLYAAGLDNPLADFIESLKYLEPLEVELVLPAHEHPFREFRKRLTQLQRHYELRLEETLEVLRKEGPATAYHVAQRLTWDPGSWDKIGPAQRHLAFLETLAYLRYLVRKGQVEEMVREGVTFYRPVGSGFPPVSSCYTA